MIGENSSQTRIGVVDLLRGFALIGVLLANFTAYTDQQVPREVLNSISTETDFAIMAFNAVFVEYKFVTLFSILFGYSFGLFIASAAKRTANPNHYFRRRMLWLFIIGLIHMMFWWFDVLHIYAICGLLLIVFRSASPRAIIAWAIALIFIVPFIYSFLTANQPDTLNENDWAQLYVDFKNGNIITLVGANFSGYWKLFIASGSNLSYFSETLGRFLLGYLLFRINFFDSIQTKRHTIRKAAVLCAPIAISYFIVRWLSYTSGFDLEVYYLEPMVKIGILATSALYASLLILAFIAAPDSLVFKPLQNIGRMTLTNYLLVSFAMVSILYGIGLGQLGKISIQRIWLIGGVWLVFEMVFSTLWLKKFRYGPVEGVWRRLTLGD